MPDPCPRCVKLIERRAHYRACLEHLAGKVDAALTELDGIDTPHDLGELLTLISDMTPAAFEAFMISARDAARRVKEVERNG